MTDDHNQTAKTSTTVEVIEQIVTNHAPEIGVVLMPPETIETGESFLFRFSATDPDNDNLAWSVKWGDGTAEIQICPSSAPNTTFDISHAWENAGTYTVQVTVRDCRGGNDTTSFTINVIEGDCHTSPLWSWDYCSPDCQCNIAEGDCDTNADCKSGYCAQNVGLNYGQVASMDVCENEENLPPVIDGLSAPTQLDVNEEGTWTIRAHDPENGVLTYSVDWGDESIPIEEEVAAKGGIQTTTFTHSYSKAGNYTIKFTVTDDHNQTAKTSTTVEVVSGGSQNIQQEETSLENIENSLASISTAVSRLIERLKDLMGR